METVVTDGHDSGHNFTCVGTYVSNTVKRIFYVLIFSFLSPQNIVLYDHV